MNQKSLKNKKEARATQLQIEKLNMKVEIFQKYLFLKMIIQSVKMLITTLPIQTVLKVNHKIPPHFKERSLIKLSKLIHQ